MPGVPIIRINSQRFAQTRISVSAALEKAKSTLREGGFVALSAGQTNPRSLNLVRIKPNQQEAELDQINFQLNMRGENISLLQFFDAWFRSDSELNSLVSIEVANRGRNFFLIEKILDHCPTEKGILKKATSISNKSSIRNSSLKQAELLLTILANPRTAIEIR